ncbi:MAG: hypothetical protein MJ213_02295 [Bacilli bacterium]|nr:hypothetical protein [Bacilli bacterium]
MQAKQLFITCSFLALTFSFASCSKTNKQLDRITISEDSKKTYVINESVVKPIVNAYYTDQSNKDVSNDCTYTGFDSSTIGDKTINVSYTENSITKTTTYTITVNEPTPTVVTLVDIKVTSFKENYQIGDDFVTPTVIATYSDETEKDVSNGCNYEGFDSTTAGEKTINVSYSEKGISKTTSFKVNVKEDTTILKYAIFADVQLCNKTTVSGDPGATANFGETANAPLALKSHLEFCKKQGINTILMNGDVTNQANEHYYQYFDEITKSVYGNDKSKWPEFLWNMGNHEWWWGTTEKETGDAVTMFRKYARIESPNLVDESDVAYSINPDVNVPSYYKVINGVPFITISAESSAGNVGSALKNEIVTWLNQAKQLYSVQAGGPIFVQYHYPLHTSMTHGQAASDTCATVEDIFKATPNAVIFTGDTHFPGISERSINQVNFTTINLGTSSYSRMVCTGATKMYNFDNVEQSGQKIADKMIGNAKFNNAYTPTIQLVSVNTNNSFTIDRYFSNEDGTGRKVGATWEFSPIKSKADFTYTNERFQKTASAQKLYGKDGLNWDINDKVTFGVNGTQATVKFPDVIDYHCCEHYLIDINGKKYDEVSNYYKNLETKGDNYFVLEDVPEAENYTVTVTAYDFYDNPSTNTLTSSNNSPTDTVDPIDYQSVRTYTDIQTRNRFDEVSDKKDTSGKTSQSSTEFYYKGIQTYNAGAIANRLYYRNTSTVSCKDYVSVSDSATSPTVRVDVKNLSNKNLVIGLSVIKWNGTKEEWKDDFSATQNIVTDNNWNTVYWDLSDYDIHNKDEIAGVFIKVKLQNASSAGYEMNCLFDNIDIIDEYPLPKYRGFELKQGVEFSKVFTPAISPTDGVFTIDIYFTSSSDTFIDFILFYTKDWNNYFGYFKVKGDGTLGDTYNGVTISLLGDGYHRVTLNLADVTNITGTRPTQNVNHFWVRTSTSTASGYIDIQPAQ